MWLAISMVLFGIFFVNVVVGSALRVSFLGDVGEMLVLFAAAICFVVAILQKESDTITKTSANKSMGGDDYEKRI